MQPPDFLKLHRSTNLTDYKFFCYLVKTVPHKRGNKICATGTYIVVEVMKSQKMKDSANLSIKFFVKLKKVL